jgi:hypothetical protein
MASAAKALDTTVANLNFFIFKSSCDAKHAGRCRCSRWQDVYRVWQDRNAKSIAATRAVGGRLATAPQSLISIARDEI